MSEFKPEQALARYIELEERRDAEFRQLPDFERRVAGGDYESFSSVDIELRELEQEGHMNAGATWYFHGDTPRRPVTEEDVLDFLQGNVVELAKARLFS